MTIKKCISKSFVNILLLIVVYLSSGCTTMSPSQLYTYQLYLSPCREELALIEKQLNNARQQKKYEQTYSFNKNPLSCVEYYYPPKSIFIGQVALRLLKISPNNLARNQLIMLINKAMEIGITNSNNSQGHQLLTSAFREKIKLQPWGDKYLAPNIYNNLVAESKVVTQGNNIEDKLLLIEIYKKYPYPPTKEQNQQLLKAIDMLIESKGTSRLPKPLLLSYARKGLGHLLYNCSELFRCTPIETMEYAENLVSINQKIKLLLNKDKSSEKYFNFNDHMRNTSYITIADIFSNRGDLVNAQTFFDLAVNDRRDGINRSSQKIEGNGTLVLYCAFSADNLINLGNLVEAEEILALGLENFNEIKSKTNATYMYVLPLMDNYVDLLIAQKRFPEAIQKIDQLKDFARVASKTGFPAPKLFRSEVLIALANKNYSLAERLLPDAMLEIGFHKEKNEYRSQSYLGKSRRDMQLAKGLLEHNFRTDEAYIILDQLFEDFTTYKNKLGRLSSSEELSVVFQEMNEHLGNDLANVAWVESQKNKKLLPAMSSVAFNALQVQMYTLPAKTIEQSAIRHAAGKDTLSQIIRKRQDLERTWFTTHSLINSQIRSSALKPEQLKMLKTKRKKLSIQIDSLEKNLSKRFPSFLELTSTKSLTLDEIQMLLTKDESLLLIVPSTVNTNIFAVSKDEVLWKRSDMTQQAILSKVQKLRNDLVAESASTNTSKVNPFCRQCAHELYLKLVEPVMPILKNKKHVFVTATGALSSLPLDILVTKEPKGADDNFDDLRNTDWLADEFAMIQLPAPKSLKLLKLMGNIRNNKSSSVDKPIYAGFGDPALKGAKNSGRGGTKITSLYKHHEILNIPIAIDVRKIHELGKLPMSGDELEAVRFLLGAPKEAIKVRENATEENVKTTDLSGIDILHFATHGLVAGAITGIVEPGLVLTPPVYPNDIDNGYLAASEVTELQLDAEWVVLSACNTAASDGQIGAPGLSGLSSAFFYAGAHSLIATHWPVNDAVATKIIPETLKNYLKKNVTSKAEALNKASKEIRINHRNYPDWWSHPAYWAPFVFVGLPN